LKRARFVAELDNVITGFDGNRAKGIIGVQQSGRLPVNKHEPSRIVGVGEHDPAGLPERDRDCNGVRRGCQRNVWGCGSVGVNTRVAGFEDDSRGGIKIRGGDGGEGGVSVRHGPGCVHHPHAAHVAGDAIKGGRVPPRDDVQIERHAADHGSHIHQRQQGERVRVADHADEAGVARADERVKVVRGGEAVELRDVGQFGLARGAGVLRGAEGFEREEEIEFDVVFVAGKLEEAVAAQRGRER
ncbi:MAG: hypothetical protein HW418_4018, partial [Anaerolineales bacterium]|nr:hypothetical protein [Anaerolineales bacterium]